MHHTPNTGPTQSPSEDVSAGAALSGSDLRRATGGGWTEEQLRAAFSLDGATMPDGQEYEDWIKGKEGRKEEGENG